MKREYLIGQIIKWEEKDKYFWNFKYPEEGEYDLLNLSLMEVIPHSFFNTPIGMFFKRKKERDFKDLETYDVRSMAMWIKRPHNYKVGDKILVEFLISGDKRNG